MATKVKSTSDSNSAMRVRCADFEFVSTVMRRGKVKVTDDPPLRIWASLAYSMSLASDLSPPPRPAPIAAGGGTMPFPMTSESCSMPYDGSRTLT